MDGYDIMCELVGKCGNELVCVSVDMYMCEWVGMCVSGWVYV